MRKSNINRCLKPSECDEVCFCSKNKSADEEYRKAQKYANKVKLINKLWYFYLQDCDMEKIEGIQKGISIFEGLSMPEIAFMFEDLDAIAIKRGCSNQCFHCYANAKPTEKEHVNYISRMPFETFTEILSGIKELSNRLGFPPVKYNGQGYTNLFYDADGMEISLFDKNGKEHDFTELNDILFDVIKIKTVFDTAGWDPNNKKLQERAEKYVTYFKDPQNMDKMFQINLSINPFNSLYMKAIELGFEPKNYNIKHQPWHPDNDGTLVSKGEKLYNNYINRMANMLMTFSSLANEKKFSVIVRAFSNSESNMKYHTKNDFVVIKNQIMATLKEKLYMDLAGDKKYVKNRNQIQTCLFYYSELLQYVDTNLIMSGRLESLYKMKNPNVKQSYIDQFFDPISSYRENFKHLKESKNLKHVYPKYIKVIDANGKLYLNDGYRFIPTEIELNIPDKNKLTQQLFPIPEDFVVTTNMVKDLYKKNNS